MPRKTSLEARFLAKVDVCEHGWECDACCWEYIGSRNKDGYGNFRIGSEIFSAHRVSWFLFKNQLNLIKSKINILHKCDNPPCQNYNHLISGTHKDNCIDRGRKKRGYHFFSDKDVKIIRSVYVILECSIENLAHKFNTSSDTISKILYKKIYLHINDNLQTRIDKLLSRYNRNRRTRPPLFGSLNGNSILNEKHVKFIRKLYNGGHSSRKLAFRFNVCQKTILDIVHYRTWKHVV